MEPQPLTNSDLALLLFSEEWAGDAGELQNAVRRTFGKLAQYLSRRLGSDGYKALLKRAVKLAAADFPWLASVRVTEEGVLEEGVLEGCSAVPEADEAPKRAEGYVAVLASLIGLLDTFIGKALSRRVLHTVWPETVRTDAESSQGEIDG